MRLHFLYKPNKTPVWYWNAERGEFLTGVKWRGKWSERLRLWLLRYVRY